jgi:type VI secretion system protein ImpA
MDAGKDSLLTIISQLSQIIEELTLFDQYLLDIIPADAPTEIKELIKVLNLMVKTINHHAEEREDWADNLSVNDTNDNDQTDTNGMNQEENTVALSMAVKKGINNRDDVIKMIDEICQYYTINEPSSPVPLLLQRAKRLVDKDFIEIIKDMAQGAVSEVTTITGFQEDKN